MVVLNLFCNEHLDLMIYDLMNIGLMKIYGITSWTVWKDK